MLIIGVALFRRVAEIRPLLSTPAPCALCVQMPPKKRARAPSATPPSPKRQALGIVLGCGNFDIILDHLPRPRPAFLSFI